MSIAQIPDTETARIAAAAMSAATLGTRSMPKPVPDQFLPVNERPAVLTTGSHPPTPPRRGASFPIDKTKDEVLQKSVFSHVKIKIIRRSSWQPPKHSLHTQPPRRQYVNFAFYKLDSAWRRLPEDERTKGKQEFLRAIEDYAGKVLVIPYTTVGIRGDCDYPALAHQLRIGTVSGDELPRCSRQAWASTSPHPTLISR